MGDRQSGTQPKRHDKLATPMLAFVASPSPAKARRRPATERPSLSTADVGPVKLPSELFALATSRSIQGDLALSKALDGIQAAATRLETERAKLVIQSQELQIWDMSREEELMLLRAENEQLEHQLAVIGEKVTKGVGRDGVLDSLQFALRKARAERDAEVREADLMFNQLQEARAAQQELQELRAALSAALSSLDDNWSAKPLLEAAVRELRTRADVGAQDPTNLGEADVATLLRGLVALASRGSELQREVQTLRGENAALQEALEVAQQQAAEQAEQQQLLQATREGPEAPTAAEALASAREEGPQQPQHYVVSALQHEVSELHSKLSEYRSYLADNQEEIEGLQNELRHLRVLQQQAADANAAPCPTEQQGHSHAAAQGGHGRQGTARAADAAGASASLASEAGLRPRQQQLLAQLRSSVRKSQQLPLPQPQLVLGTPTRHLPSAGSPISTINYGGSPQPAGTPPNRRSPLHQQNRGSPLHQQTAADIAYKVSELQELAVRAQQQAVEHEAELALQHEQQLEALQQVAALAQQRADELATIAAKHAQQYAQARAHAQAREAELSQQHARSVAELEEQAVKLASQHSQALIALHGQIAQLSAQHAQALADRDVQAAQHLAQRLQQRETELLQQQAEALVRQAAQAEAQQAQALAEQAAKLDARYTHELSEQAARLASQHERDQRELEARLVQQHADQQARRDAEMRGRHAERLAEQAAQLARLHAEQAAAAGSQHAAALAEREAQLLRQFEETLVEREGELANAHADQLRELEARTVAWAAEAAAEREAQLQLRFAEQLAEALRLQQAQLAAQAEARLADAAKQAQMSYMTEVARLAREHEQEVERREGELTRQLDERRREMEGLEAQVAQAREALASAAVAAEASAAAEENKGDGSTVDACVADLGGEVLGITGNGAGGVTAAALEEELSELRRQLAQVGEQLSQREELLAQREEQLTQREAQLEQLAQQRARDVEVALAEGEWRQEAAVAALERQYVEVVARLGREHEQATMEIRAASELREGNLRRALERQAQEAREAQQQLEERLRDLQNQLADLRAQMKERQEHAEAKEALQERVQQLLQELQLREAHSQSRTPAPEEAAQRQVQQQPKEHGQQVAHAPVSSLPSAASPGSHWRRPPQARQGTPSHDGPSPAALPSASASPAVPEVPLHALAAELGPKQQSPHSPVHAGAPSRPAAASPASVVSPAPTQPPNARQCDGADIAQLRQDVETLTWPAPPLPSSASPHRMPRTNIRQGSVTAPITDPDPDSEEAAGQDAPPRAPASSTTSPVPSSASQLARSEQPLYTRSEDWSGHSQQEFPARLIHAIGVVEPDADGRDEAGAGKEAGGTDARRWASTSVDSVAPRQALLLRVARLSAEAPGSGVGDVSLSSGTDGGPSVAAVTGADAKLQVGQLGAGVSTEGQGMEGAPAEAQEENAAVAGDDDQGERRSALDKACSGAEDVGRQGGQVAEEKWDELTAAAPVAPADPSAEEQEALRRSAGDGGGCSSAAACSVSTTSSYNSETECYVDDDEEEDAASRGRALAAALAQVRVQQVAAAAAAAAAAAQTSPPPPAQQGLQRRRMYPQQQEEEQQQLEEQPEGVAPPVGGSSSGSPLPSSIVLHASSRSPIADVGSPNVKAYASPASPGGGRLEVSLIHASPSRRLPLPPLRRSVQQPATASVTHGSPCRSGAPPAVAVPSPVASPASSCEGVDLEATLSSPFPLLLPAWQPSSQSEKLHSAEDDGAGARPCAPSAAAVPTTQEAAAPPSPQTRPSESPQSSGGRLSGGRLSVEAAKCELAASLDAFRFVVAPLRFTPRLDLECSDTGAVKLLPSGNSCSYGNSGIGYGVSSGARDEACNGTEAADVSEAKAATAVALRPVTVGDLSASFDFSSDARARASADTATLSTPLQQTPLGAYTCRSGLSPRAAAEGYNGSSSSSGGGSVEAAAAGSPHGADRDGHTLLEPTRSLPGAASCGSWGSGLGGAHGGVEQESPADYSAVFNGAQLERRSSMGTTCLKPLMLPNPLYEIENVGDMEDTDTEEEAREVSPPWSMADWDTPAGSKGSPLNEDGAARSPATRIPYIPSTPSSNPSESLSSEGSSSDEILSTDELEVDTPDPEVAEAGVGPLLALLGSHSLPSSICSRGGSPGRYGSVPATPTSTHAMHQAPGGCGMQSSAGPRSVAGSTDGVQAAQQEQPGTGVEGNSNNSSNDACVSADHSRDHDRERPRRAAESGEGSADVGQSVPLGTEAEAGEDDAHSLLAAGASLGSSEMRRRQRRRMGDVSPRLCQPLDLLRQSWSFSHGVATPLSPRTATYNGWVQGHLVGHADGALPSAVSPTTSAAGLRSPSAKNTLGVAETVPPQLQQAAQPAPAPSPPPTQHLGCQGPLATPPSSSHATAAGTMSTSLVASTSITPSHSTPAAASALPTPTTRGAPSSLLSAASAGGPASASASAGLGPVAAPSSSQEVRQRGRAVLGRVLGRVAHLEDHCRALQAVHQTPPGTSGPSTLCHSSAGAAPHAEASFGTVAAAEGSIAASADEAPLMPPLEPTVRSTAAHGATSDGQATGSQLLLTTVAAASATAAAALSPLPTGAEGTTPKPTSSGDGQHQQRPQQLSFFPSEETPSLEQQRTPDVAASVLGALEELRGDLFELEKLHRLSLRGTAATATRGSAVSLGNLSRSRTPGSLGMHAASGGPFMSPGNRSGMGIGGEDKALMVAASSCSTRTTAMEDPKSGGSALRHSAAWLLHPLSPHQQKQQPTSPHSQSHPASTSGPTDAHHNLQPTSPSASPLVPSLHAGSPAPPSSATPPPAALHAPSPLVSASSPMSPSFASATPSLDPALVSLLEVSIQAQLQGQLGQLQAKVEELQRQNQVLLAAAANSTNECTTHDTHSLGSTTGAVRVAEAVVSTSPVMGLGAGVTAVVATPVHVATTLAFASPPAAAASGGSRTEAHGGGGGGEALGSRWAGLDGNVVWGAARGIGVGLGSGGGSRGQAEMPGLVCTRTSALTVASTTARMPMQASAGPFSPEELSQLPPTVQLFAPPQLRAAAVAAAHESAKT